MIIGTLWILIALYLMNDNFTLQVVNVYFVLLTIILTILSASSMGTTELIKFQCMFTKWLLCYWSDGKLLWELNIQCIHLEIDISHNQKLSGCENSFLCEESLDLQYNFLPIKFCFPCFRQYFVGSVPDLWQTIFRPVPEEDSPTTYKWCPLEPAAAYLSILF